MDASRTEPAPRVPARHSTRAAWSVAVTVVLALALAAPAGAWAQQADGQQPEPSGPVAALLSETPRQRLQMLESMRARPEVAHQQLRQALQSEAFAGQRGRVAHHLIEFGQPEDVALLLELLPEAGSPRQAELLRGAVRALYEPLDRPEALALMVQEFSFVQTRPPRSASPAAYALTDWSFGQLHLAEVPLSAISALEPLRGRSYEERRALLDAMRERLRQAVWSRYESALLAAVEAHPARTTVEGVVRVRLRNPVEQPLVVAVGAGVWFGEASPPPAPRWVYLPTGQSRTVELTTTLTGAPSRGGVRLDLRLREVNGRPIPDQQKLYVPLGGEAQE